MLNKTNKIFALTFIVFFTFSHFSLIRSSEQTKQFVDKLFSILSKDNYTSSSDCLGNDFNKELNNLKNQIQSQNLDSAIISIRTLSSLIITDYDILSINKIYQNTIQNYKQQEILANAFNYTKDIMMLLQEFFNRNIDTKNIGNLIGDLANVLIYDQSTSTNESFLEIPEIINFNFISSKIEDFVDGIFEGVSSVPFEHNQCNIQIKDFKPLIIEKVKDVFRAIKTRKDIGHSLYELFSLLKTELPPFEYNCHFIELTTNIVGLISEVGLAKLIFKLTMHPFGVFNSLKDFVLGIKHSDYETAGKGLGEFLSLALGWYTN